MKTLKSFRSAVLAVLAVLLAASCADGLGGLSFGRRAPKMGGFSYSLEFVLDDGEAQPTTRSMFFDSDGLKFEDLAENAAVLLYTEDGILAASQFIADEYLVSLVTPGDDDYQYASGPEKIYTTPKKLAVSGSGENAPGAYWQVISEGWKMPSSGSQVITFDDIKVNVSYYVYAIGNLPIPHRSSYASETAWYDAITDFIVDNFGTTAQLGYYNVTMADMMSEGLRIPYVHIPDATTFVENNSSITIPMQRAMAKGRIVVDASSLSGTFTLDENGISVKQSVKTCWPFRPGYAAESTSEVGNGDCCEDGGVVYFYENCQGTLLPTNTNPADKNMDILASSGKAGLCTYIEVKGEYTLNDFTTDVTYRFYLGDDNTSNFDVRRNVSRTYTLYLTDANILNGGTGWKIDPERVPEVTSLVITPSTFAMEVGDQQAFAVTAVYNTGRSEVVTPYCGWSASAGLSMSSNVATATAGNTDAYVTATWQGKSTTATGSVKAVTSIDLVMPSAMIYGYEDANIYAGYYAMYLQSQYDNVDANQRQLQVYKVWNDGTRNLVTDPAAEGVTFTKVSGSANMYLSSTGRLHINISNTQTVIRATYNGMTDDLTITPKDLTVRLLDLNGNYMSDPYTAQIGDIIPKNYGYVTDNVMTEWSSSVPVSGSWDVGNSSVLARISQMDSRIKAIAAGSSSYGVTLLYFYTNAVGNSISGQRTVSVTVNVPAAPVVDNPTYTLKVSPATATIGEGESETFNAIKVTHHTDGRADEEAVVVASWSLTTGSSYAGISGQGTNTVRVSNANATYSDKSATLQASYNGMIATSALTLIGRDDEVSQELVVVPATVSISSTGSVTLTAKIVTHHSDGSADTESPATGAQWTVISGNSYVTLGSTSGSSITVSGSNDTYSSQTSVVRASIAGLTNPVATNDDCEITVGARTAVYTYALEIVPGDDFTLTVGGYRQLKAYLVAYLDGIESSRTDVTTSASWSSSNTSKVTVSTSGSYERVNGVGETTSPVTVTATYNNAGQSLTDNVLVTAVYGNTFSISGGSNLEWEWNEYGSGDGKSVHVTAPSNKMVSVSYVGGDNYDKFYKSETSFYGSKDITFYPVGKNTSTNMIDYFAAVRISCEGYSPITVSLTQYNGVQQSVVVDPPSATITYNGTQQYRAYLVFKELDDRFSGTEGAEITRLEVTGQCIWEVRTNTQNATISSTGLVTGTRSDRTGSAYMTSTIRARYNGISGTASVRVGKAPDEPDQDYNVRPGGGNNGSGGGNY